MRLATAWFVVVGVAILGTAGPVRAQTTSTDGFWFSVAAGVAGSATPSAYQEWWFETPHGPPSVAVTSLTGTTAQATTAGGSSFFTGAATPLVLSPTNGYAYIANGTQPSDLSQALTRQMSGGTGLASAAPVTSATSIPAGSDQLSISQSGNALTVTLTDSSNDVLANATVNVPTNGWWVIGLGPNPDSTTSSTSSTTTTATTTTTTVSVPVPGPPSSTGPVAAPEPATGLLTGIGGLGALGFRLCKRRRAE
jgi:hypothetical protein